MTPVEFDGRVAAVAREEIPGKYKTVRITRLDIYQAFLPARAYGANSTNIGSLLTS